MLHHRGIIVNIHIREGMSAALAAQQERVTTAVVAGIVGCLSHLH